jgi:serine O-acetyltransferase
MSAAARWKADKERYGPRGWAREQSWWSVAVLRLGEWADEGDAPAQRLARALYWPLYRIVQTITGIALSKEVQVGGGLRIHHFGGIFVSSGVRIGERCTLRQGVTLGERYDGGPVPTLGDEVELGAYAQVLGGVHIGDNAKIGAMSVVLEDVPANATAAGVPATWRRSNPSGDAGAGRATR